jgi:hypothetical protein
MPKPRGKKDCDEQLVLILSAGGSVSHAAEKAGVSERTVRRRLEDQQFRQRISEARSELIQGAIGRLSMIGRKAVDKLNKLMDDPDPKICLGSSRAVLQYMLSGHEHELLAAQVAELQRQIDELTHEAASH